MRTLALLTSLVCLSACGESTPQDPLEGTWLLLHPDGVCSDGFTFEDGAFTFQTLCKLSDGSFGDDILTGSFSVSGPTIALDPTKASCPSHWSPGAFDVGYNLNGNRLTVVLSSSALVFDRFVDNGSGNGGALIRTGCWNADDTFTQNPVTPL